MSEIIGVVLRCDHSVGRVQPIRTCRDLVTPDRSNSYPCAHGAARAYTRPNGDIRTRANADADPGTESHSYSNHHSDLDLCSDSYAYADSHAHADYYTHAHTDSGTIRTLRGHSCTGASRLHVVGVEPGTDSSGR